LAPPDKDGQMSVTRNNHYVPQWYQAGFFEPNGNTLAYVDLKPDKKILHDGRVISSRSQFNSPTSRAFRQKDLYSTFFGTSVNDEIEKKLFGDIDTRGSLAVRAFFEDNPVKWHDHFQNLFEFIDAQKLRTPKGLDWIRSQYPGLKQNELMIEMQGLRMMHCTIWTEGVREIVSAEDADMKFIISDHPVTVYNKAASPDLPQWKYPNDPSILLKGSQTVFPLSRNFCLILTNLEYAENSLIDPLERRIFARNFRQSIVRTDSFIRERKLNNDEVAAFNLIIKRGAKRYLAAGQKEWLEPEIICSRAWNEVGEVLKPPSNKLYHFGGELFAKFDDGHVHYQDAFGRTEKPREFLQKTVKKDLHPKEACGCGSGFRFRDCCQNINSTLRPTWSEKSIRERNMMLLNAISHVLELNDNKDWLQVRRELTNEKISEIYGLYESLWPLETDILSLLPKPDGRVRAVYTGFLHPETIADYALGASWYFGEILVQHPFLHPGIMKKDFIPLKNPKAFRQEFLKSLLLFIQISPLVECGLINLVPDPCDFDIHLREQMMAMAEARRGFIDPDLLKGTRIEEIMKKDAERGILALPDDALGTIFSRSGVAQGEIEETQLLKAIQIMRENDPLSELQGGSIDSEENAGQFTMIKLAPNFEMAMYLAQATGAAILTDNIFRWQEIQLAVLRRSSVTESAVPAVKQSMEAGQFAFFHHPQSIGEAVVNPISLQYADFMKSLFKHLLTLPNRPSKPNFEAGLKARFERTHRQMQSVARKSGYVFTNAKMQAAFPIGGIQDNTINRLLLMSNSEHHLRSAPMAFYFSTGSEG
jgi:hypothetical protein